MALVAFRRAWRAIMMVFVAVGRGGRGVGVGRVGWSRSRGWWWLVVLVAVETLHATSLQCRRIDNYWFMNVHGFTSIASYFTNGKYLVSSFQYLFEMSPISDHCFF